MERWLAKLKGDRFDIEDYPRWFPTGEIRALAEGDSVFIVGSRFESLNDPSQVHELAALALEEFYAVGCLLSPGLQRPTIEKVIREDAVGNRRGFVFASVHDVGRAKMRVAVVVSGEDGRNEGPTDAQLILAASQGNRELRLAVLLWADPMRSWPRLYRIMEEIESYLGSTVSKARLCSDNQRERFTRSANSADVAGKDARHGSGKFEAPSNPMSVDEGIEWIRGLLKRVLEQAGGGKAGTH